MVSSRLFVLSTGNEQDWSSVQSVSAATNEILWPLLRLGLASSGLSLYMVRFFQDQ